MAGNNISFDDISTGISYENFPKDPAAREAIAIVNNKVEELKDTTVGRQAVINLENKVKQSGLDNDNFKVQVNQEITSVKAIVDGIDGGNTAKLEELEAAVNDKAPRDLVDSLLGQIEGSVKQINGMEPDENGNVIIDLDTAGLATSEEVTQKTDAIANLVFTKAETSAVEIIADNVTDLTTQVGLKATKEEFTTKTDALTSQLADIEKYVIYAEKYNIKSSNSNNHDQIISALNALKAKGGGTLLLPTGIKTSPISFQGYDNITIRGLTTSLPWSIPPTIIIVGNNPIGSVGLQFSDSSSGNDRPIWEAKFCKLENMFIDCDNKCDYGVNGNLGLELKDVCVRKARLDGIVCENFTYPLFFDKVYSQYNGRHGIHIKGGMTTCYAVEKSEFNYNGGLGLLIEGGARATFNDCYAQGNAQGGYTINYKNGVVGDYYLENMVIDIYTEANGNLLPNNPNYSGNYQAIITGFDKTNNALSKPKRLDIKGALNAGVDAKALKIDSVFGCKISAQISGTIDISNGGVLGLEFTTSPSITAVPSIGNGFGVTSYSTTYESPTSLAGTIYNGLWFPSRGKTEKMIFKLESIAAGSAVLMKTLYDEVSNLASGYKAFKEGSIVGVGLYKGNVNGVVAGSLTVKPVKASNQYTLAVDPTIDFDSFTSLVLSANQFDLSHEFPPAKFSFDKNEIIGLQITASSDYNAGFNTSLIGYIIIEN